MQDGDLKTSINTLARQIEFPLNGVYVIEKSNWFGYKNVETVGITRENYIIVNEILLPKKKGDDPCEGYPELNLRHILDEANENEEKRFQKEEILALTAHELGHWHDNHFYKLFAALLLYYMAMFALFGLTYQKDIIFAAFGFPDDVKPILAGLFSVLSYIITPYNIIANFLLNVYSQHLEYQADQFTYNLGFSKPLKNALIKLHKDSIIFPRMNPCYSRWKFDQPTLPERLQALDSLDHNVNRDMQSLLNEKIKKGLAHFNVVLERGESQAVCMFTQNLDDEEYDSAAEDVINKYVLDDDLYMAESRKVSRELAAKKSEELLKIININEKNGNINPLEETQKYLTQVEQTYKDFTQTQQIKSVKIKQSETTISNYVGYSPSEQHINEDTKKEIKNVIKKYEKSYSKIYNNRKNFEISHHDVNNQGNANLNQKSNYFMRLSDQIDGQITTKVSRSRKFPKSKKVNLNCRSTFPLKNVKTVSNRTMNFSRRIPVSVHRKDSNSLSKENNNSTVNGVVDRPKTSCQTSRKPEKRNYEDLERPSTSYSSASDKRQIKNTISIVTGPQSASFS